MRLFLYCKDNIFLNNIQISIKTFLKKVKPLLILKNGILPNILEKTLQIQKKFINLRIQTDSQKPQSGARAGGNL